MVGSCQLTAHSCQLRNKGGIASRPGDLAAAASRLSPCPAPPGPHVLAAVPSPSIVSVADSCEVVKRQI
jgi:hypothetical protein